MVVLLAAGCSLAGDADPAASGTAPAAAATTSAAGPRGGQAASTGPELLSAGDEPRTALRFALTEGSISTVSVTTDVASVQGEAALARTIDPPPVTQTLRYRVGKVSGDGALVAFRVTSVAVDAAGTDLGPDQALTLTKALQAAEGITGSGHLSATGSFSDARLEVPAGVPAATRADVDALPGQIAQLQPVLPTEPVGVGGSWRSTDTATIAGVTVDQTTTYTVTAIEGSSVRYRSSFAATGHRQNLPSEGLAPGATLELVSSEASGEGRGTIDLTSLAQTAATHATATQVLTLTAPSSTPQRLGQRLELATRVRPATAG